MNQPRPASFTIISLLLSIVTVARAGDEVVIYYANETAPTAREARNYDTMIDWLEGDAENGRKTARSLKKDLRLFSAIVDVETSQLEQAAIDSATAPHVLIFTNRTVREGRARLLRRGWTEVREVELPFSAHSDNYILAANPLSRAEIFAEVLKFSAQLFDPQDHEFVLITKSHGAFDRVMTPRLTIQAEKTSRDELMSILRGELETDGLAAWKTRPGVTSSDYLAVLQDAGREHGMQFSVVFHEACHAKQAGFDRNRLPANVGNLLLVWEQSNYINVLYPDVLADEGRSFCQSLLSNLPPKFVVVNRDNAAPATSNSLPRFVFFIPLALYLAWIACGWPQQVSRTGAASV